MSMHLALSLRIATFVLPRILFRIDDVFLLHGRIGHRFVPTGFRPILHVGFLSLLLTGLLAGRCRLLPVARGRLHRLLRLLLLAVSDIGLRHKKGGGNKKKCAAHM